MSFPKFVDVLLVGAGPTSLLLTELLVHAGGLKILTIEQHNKFEQGLLGRACMLYAGSLEILDLVGMYERIADIGFIVRNAITFKDGVELPSSKGWSFVAKALSTSDTLFDFSFSIRQKYIEDAFRGSIAQLDPNVIQAPVKLLSYRDAISSEYPITATVDKAGEILEVNCKYLIGADGGRSTVRSLGHFPFPGTASIHKWVRLDAIVTTNIPFSRSKGVGIESKDFGHILWVPTDNDRTRIGFVCPPDVYAAGNMTEETIMDLAQKAVKPFTLEFVKLDWWTVYSLGQRVAETFRDGRVFLAGDAAHTHSSGGAQGMNTGLHDAINLGWKLSGVLSGLYSESILDTYDSERRSAAERVIEIDRDTSALISGQIPDHFNAPPDADVNAYLDKVNEENATFTVGLGISYGPNILNQSDSNKTSLIGHRAPDSLVYRPGRKSAQPLRHFISYTGHFWILIFAGALETTLEAARLNKNSAASYSALWASLGSSSVNFLTIVHGQGSLQSAETLGSESLGKLVFDHTGRAFSNYGVSGEGALVAVRPDGIIGLITALSGGENLRHYLSQILRTPPPEALVQDSSKSYNSLSSMTEGEIDVEGQQVSTYFSQQLDL